MDKGMKYPTPKTILEGPVHCHFVHPTCTTSSRSGSLDSPQQSEAGILKLECIPDPSTLCKLTIWKKKSATPEAPGDCSPALVTLEAD